MAQGSEEEKQKKGEEGAGAAGEFAGRAAAKQLAKGGAARAGGAAAGTAAGAGGGAAAGAAGGAAAGAGAGAAAGAAGGPAAPVTVPAGAVAGAIGSQVFIRLWKYTKWLFAAGCGCVTLLVFGPVILAGIIVILILTIFLGGVMEGEAGNGPPEETPILVTKTASPSWLDIGDPGETTYTIKIKNNTPGEATDVVVSDTFSGTHASVVTSDCDFTIASIPSGSEAVRTCDAGNINTSEDWILVNDVAVTTEVITHVPGDLDFYILYGDTSIVPADPADIKSTADASWPDNNIDVPCPGGVTCWDYVISQSIANGISPAFSIAIWWEEGGFGGILPGGGRANSEFGCFPGGDTNQSLNFQTSFNCFVEFTSNEHPYDSSDPNGSFVEWVRYFCGPEADPICSNNPGFISRLRSVYDDVAPGEIVVVPGGGEDLVETMTGHAQARVFIGSTLGDGSIPSGCPMNGTITTPYGFHIPGYVHNGWHWGVDIGDGPGTNTTIVATLTGQATLIESWGGGHGLSISNEEYEIKYWHLLFSGRVSGLVNIGDPVAIEDTSGGSITGEHLHYGVLREGVYQNPLNYMPVTLNFTQPPDNDFAETPIPSGGWGSCP